MPVVPWGFLTLAARAVTRQDVALRARPLTRPRRSTPCCVKEDLQNAPTVCLRATCNKANDAGLAEAETVNSALAFGAGLGATPSASKEDLGPTQMTWYVAAGPCLRARRAASSRQVAVPEATPAQHLNLLLFVTQGLGMSSPSGQPSTEDTTSASQDMVTDTANDLAQRQHRPGDRKRPGGSGAGRGAVPANGWGEAARAPGTAATAGSQLPQRALTSGLDMQPQPLKPEAATDGSGSMAVPGGSWGPSSLSGGQFAQRAMANLPPAGMHPPGAGRASEPLGPGPRSLRAVSQPLMAARPSSGVQQQLGLPPLDEAAGGRAGPGHARSRSHTFGGAALPLQALELGPGAPDFPIEEADAEGNDQEQPEPSGRSGSRSSGPRGGRAARSGSGNDSGGGGKDKDKSRGANNGRSNKELLLLDPKRVKRIIANRLVGCFGWWWGRAMALGKGARVRTHGLTCR